MYNMGKLCKLLLTVLYRFLYFPSLTLVGRITNFMCIFSTNIINDLRKFDNLKKTLVEHKKMREQDLRKMNLFLFYMYFFLNVSF